MSKESKNSKEDREDLQRAHNRGEKDASKGEYDPPIDTFRSVLGMYDKTDIERDEAYREGWRNTKDQKD